MCGSGPAAGPRGQLGEAPGRRTWPGAGCRDRAAGSGRSMSWPPSDQVVGAVAEEGEVVVLGHSSSALASASSSSWTGAAARRARPGWSGPARAWPASPRRRLDVVRDPLDLGAQPVQDLRLALAVDLEVQIGLADAVGGVGRQHLGQLAGLVAAHGDHRVDGQVDDQAVAVQLHGHRVDQERHVVGDDLHDRVGAPAVLLEPGAVDADLGLAGLPAVASRQWARTAPYRSSGSSSSRSSGASRW